MRDTDADWRHWGENEPYFGVLAEERYLRRNLTPESLADFWASGVRDAGGFAKRIELSFGPFKKETALDFGCGVGRLTRGMALLCDHATGLDIAPSMLAEARQGAPANVDFISELDDRTFDWINSIIVFQHIPPERGYALIEALLERVNLGGAISLHVTIGGPPSALDGPVGAMSMFAYDLSRITVMLGEKGFVLTLLQHTDHGGHIGVVIYGRRARTA